MKPWRVNLTCCGREDGFIDADTWSEADQMREYYTSGPAIDPQGYSGDGYHGHQRSAVVTRTRRSKVAQGDRGRPRKVLRTLAPERKLR